MSMRYISRFGMYGMLIISITSGVLTSCVRDDRIAVSEQTVPVDLGDTESDDSSVPAEVDPYAVPLGVPPSDARDNERDTVPSPGEHAPVEELQPGPTGRRGWN